MDALSTNMSKKTPYWPLAIMSEVKHFMFFLLQSENYTGVSLWVSGKSNWLLITIGS